MPPVVVVRPLSGYANRMQAIVSAALLAEELGSEFLVAWDESEVAPVPASAVLGPAWCAAHVRDAQTVRERFGVDPTRIPEYLHQSDAGRVITLAGLDRGEQHFMPDLRSALAANPGTEALVISAGGRFTLEGDAVLTPAQERTFRQRRYEGYAELPLNAEIERAAAAALIPGDFLGLHLRYSDRSAQTPWQRQIAPALARLVQATGTQAVFVASDTPPRRESWVARLSDLGLRPWTCDPGDFPRSDPRSATGALVDWRILTRSQAMVYFAASSFAEEASVASGNYDLGIGLTASGARSAWVRAGEYIHAARTYPRRHGWVPNR